MDNKTNKKKVIIIGNGYKNSISDDFFKDVIEGNCENAYYYFFWEVKNPIINFIRRIYFTKRWNIYKKIPWFVNFFKKYNALERVKKEEEDVIVIINLASQYSNLVTKEDILGLKKNNVTLILFCVDAIDSPQMNRGEVVSWFPLFDYVICDNPEDAEHYGIYYHLDPYPWKNYVGENNKIDNYLFFLGRGKDRTAYCRILADFLDERKIEYDFSIIGNEKDQME